MGDNSRCGDPAHHSSCKALVDAEFQASDLMLLAVSWLHCPLFWVALKFLVDVKPQAVVVVLLKRRQSPN
jgi:hypothetical protein